MEDVERKECQNRENVRVEGGKRRNEECMIKIIINTIKERKRRTEDKGTGSFRIGSEARERRRENKGKEGMERRRHGEERRVGRGREREREAEGKPRQGKERTARFSFQTVSGVRCPGVERPVLSLSHFILSFTLAPLHVFIINSSEQGRLKCKQTFHNSQILPQILLLLLRTFSSSFK